MDIGKLVVGHDDLEPGSRQIQSLDEEWLLRYLQFWVLGQQIILVLITITLKLRGDMLQTEVIIAAPTR